MKHAYLIIAHNNYEQLNLLVSLLDDPRNDIYIHIDKKSPEPDSFKLKYSKVVLIPKESRIDVRWGDVSQIECELVLYDMAFKSKQEYSYYHLLSGVDLPIKSMDFIHNFFDIHSGTNFIGIGKSHPNELKNKIGKRHYFRKHFREKNILRKIIYKVLRFITEVIANVFKPSMMNPNIEYKKGANWSSLTNDFVNLLLQKKEHILKHYKQSRCCDEVYKQTLIWNSEFKYTIFNKDDEFASCLRLIDWNRGNPYTFGKEVDKDKELITNSCCLFARKFDYNLYPDIIQYVRNLISFSKSSIK